MTYNMVQGLRCSFYCMQAIHACFEISLLSENYSVGLYGKNCCRWLSALTFGIMSHCFSKCRRHRFISVSWFSICMLHGWDNSKYIFSSAESQYVGVVSFLDLGQLFFRVTWTAALQIFQRVSKLLAHFCPISQCFVHCTWDDDFKTVRPTDF